MQLYAFTLYVCVLIHRNGWMNECERYDDASLLLSVINKILYDYHVNFSDFLLWREENVWEKKKCARVASSLSDDKNSSSRSSSSRRRRTEKIMNRLIIQVISLNYLEDKINGFHVIARQRQINHISQHFPFSSCFVPHCLALYLFTALLLRIQKLLSF